MREPYDACDMCKFHQMNKYLETLLRRALPLRFVESSPVFLEARYRSAHILGVPEEWIDVSFDCTAGSLSVRPGGASPRWFRDTWRAHFG